MTSRLPVVSGDDLVKALGKFGYVVVRQKGSHIRMRHALEKDRKPLTIPRHRTIKRGLLKDILRDAGISPEQLAGAL